MTISEAIKKAIEGGYDRTRSRGLEGECRINFCLLDPQFWQCLGKAMGWDETGVPLSLCQLHRFVDHLWRGETPESFFKDLK